jgi:hypothetical protein
MGKSNFLTPKGIANRIKAKGLQKLWWYRQKCQKQCRDENGFKCHKTGIFNFLPLKWVDSIFPVATTTLATKRENTSSFTIFARVARQHGCPRRLRAHVAQQMTSHTPCLTFFSTRTTTDA